MKTVGSYCLFIYLFIDGYCNIIKNTAKDPKLYASQEKYSSPEIAIYNIESKVVWITVRGTALQKGFCSIEV